MYQHVGNDLLAVDPGALIIAEGPQSWSGVLLNGKSGIAPDGDLTVAAARPVNLSVSGKVLYSAHEYPSNIGGEPSDSGTSYIQQMNRDWGYLVSGNIAPVWIGEIGASMDGSNHAKGDDRNWANTIVPYLNGADGGQGGPTFTGSNQPVPIAWWLVGRWPGENPDGYFASWTGSPMPANSAQASVVTQFAPRLTGANTPIQAATVTAGNPHIVTGQDRNVILTDNDQRVLLRSGARFINNGNDNIIGVEPFGRDIDITAHGRGTQLVIKQLVGQVTIRDFEGANAHVTFTNSLPYGTVEQALAAVQPDGAGGVRLGNVDFVNTPTLTAADISIART